MNTKKLSLDRCTKETCKKCDLGYIIKDYVKPLMQCLTLDIKDYYMRLLVSKCLNNAILISFFMTGKKKALQMGNYCDTHATTKRHESGEQNNADLIDKLDADLLYKKNIKHRYLYYILMTDAYLPTDNTQEEHKFFCGHVFIIEKIPGENGSLPFYYFYQSYINEYDFKGHIEKNKNTLKKTYEEMYDMLKKIKYILLNKHWDDTSVKYWKDITFVDTSQLKGGKPHNKIYLCYSKTKLKECIKHIEKYVRGHLKIISKHKNEDMNKIYGDSSLYDADQQPLTVYRMKTSLEKLQNTIIEHKFL
jgi:hypothetical protein